MKEEGHRICSVQPGSIAAALDVEPGDCLLAVGGEKIADIFDYRLLIAEDKLDVLIRKQDGEEWLLEIEKDPGEDLGLVFASDLMDDYRACCNHCVFCFIDQMPPGMRETLYFKDDDSRLSFLQGNYITLTNMSEHDIDRVIQYHMEPINISFHTTDPKLRAKMLGNPRAGDIFPHVRRLADAGISMNGQIVLCKGWNDGAALDQTIGDLATYLPALGSVSVVPVGLTKHRKKLAALESFHADDAAAVLAQIHRWQKQFRAQTGTGFVYAADEWYLSAGEELPGEEEYDGYPQLENGVGMLRSLQEEVRAALEEELPADGGAEDGCPGSVTLATGVLAAPFLEQLVADIRRKHPQITAQVAAIRNRFFGETITVSGLITGQDLVEQLSQIEVGDRLLIPDNMLRSGEDVFLDDLHVTDLERAIGVPVTVVGPSGRELVEAVCGRAAVEHRKRKQGYEQADPGDRGAAERR